MKLSKNQKMLFDAVSGIDADYIEEAIASPARTFSPVWKRIAVMAAVFALVICAVSFAGPTSGQCEPVPFFAVRAYAANGDTATLNLTGDTVQIASNPSTPFSSFPGKETYTLDISLGDYTGDPTDFSEGSFHFLHRGKLLEPGESDDFLKIEWLQSEKDGFCGYRITGWCDDVDFIDLLIRDAAGRIIHQKSLMITYKNGYWAELFSSFTYREGLSTDALIDQVLAQNYMFTTSIASTNAVAYSALVSGHGGFADLEARPDAPTLLLERYVRIMNGESLYGDNDWIVGLMLSRDVYWEQLTQGQKALFSSFGMWRDPEDPSQNTSVFDTFFPGKEIFTYEIILEGENRSDYSLTVSYDGHNVSSRDEHIVITHLLPVGYGEAQQFGWILNGWFDKPTVVSITVTHRSGAIVRQEDVRITFDSEYHYEILDPVI